MVGGPNKNALVNQAEESPDCYVVTRAMRGVLNEATDTVHKREPGESDFQTACGATAHVPHDDLRVAPVDPTVASTNASKCGRCFDDGKGY